MLNPSSRACCDGITSMPTSFSACLYARRASIPTASTPRATANLVDAGQEAGIPGACACCPFCCPLPSRPERGLRGHSRIRHGTGLALDAGGGNRTHTPRGARDFESRASASSATPARRIVASSARGYARPCCSECSPEAGTPGLNPCIKRSSTGSPQPGTRCSGSAGAGGPPELRPDDPEASAEHLERLDPASVRTIDRTGGTVLHTSRTNPGGCAARGPAFLAGRRRARARSTSPRTSCARSSTRDRRARRDRRRRHPVVRAAAGRRGRPVIAIPKTMDNDVHGTDYCIGFSTAVTRGVQFIHNLRTSAGATSGSPSSSSSAATRARRR